MDKIENLPATERPLAQGDGEQTTITARLSAMYVGAVPPPEVLDVYEHHAPGAATRFIEFVENEQRLQFEIAKRNFDLANRNLDLQEQELAARERENKMESNDFRLGLAASTLIMLFLFGFMFFCAHLRLEAALIAALGVPLLGAIGSIVAHFVWRKKGGR